MKKLTVVLLSAASSAAVLIVACSSSSTSNPGNPGGDGGTAADTSTSSSDGGTAGDTAPPEQDAAVEDSSTCAPYKGAIPNDAGAQCHDLVSNAQPVTVIADPGALPVGTGGTVADGLYYLTEARAYPGSPLPPGTVLKYAILIAGDMSYTVDDNGATVRRTTKKNPDGGAGIVLCETKTDNNPPAGSQTATCSSLTSYDSVSLFSAKFVKQ
jgi:hypothetical protein